MLFSVITVTYNVVDVIEDTIKSVINQNVGNIEYIIIDGGSTDGTVDVIRNYEQYISYWNSEPDTGIYDAMNKGIRVASGDVIAFLNAGDSYLANTFSIVEKKIAEYDLLVANANMILNGKCVGVFPVNIENFEFQMPFCHQALFARRNVFSKIGVFNTEYRICADFEWINRAYHSKQFKQIRINEIIVDFDMSGVGSKDHITRNAELCKVIKTYLKDAEYKNACVREIIRLDYLGTALYMIEHKKDLVMQFLLEYFDNKSGFIIWGTEYWGKSLFEILRANDICIKAVVDSNVHKLNLQFDETGYYIKSPDIIKNDNLVIIATENRVESIKKKLINIGLGENQFIFIRDLLEMIAIIEKNKFS